MFNLIPSWLFTWKIGLILLGIILLLVGNLAFDNLLVRIIFTLFAFICFGWSLMLHVQEKEEKDSSVYSFGCSDPSTNACCPGRLGEMKGHLSSLTNSMDKVKCDEDQLTEIKSHLSSLSKSINQIESICSTGKCDSKSSFGFGCGCDK